jgi:hypothetical protein
MREVKTHRNTDENPEGSRPFGRPNHRRNDNIKCKRNECGG